MIDIYKKYKVIDTKEKITIADSFVVNANKIGTANGEAKLYIGQDGEFLRSFFGDTCFSISCFLLKQDLTKYLDEVKEEYFHSEQEYRKQAISPELWTKRKERIDNLDDVISFQFNESTQIKPPRIYGKSENKDEYNLIRELSIPNITYISILKLEDKKSKEIIFYFKLFSDYKYFGTKQHPNIEKNEILEIEKIAENTNKVIKKQARIGQGKYRQAVLKEAPFCPITMISDDRLLIASHIKPWSKSEDNEKTDPKNGFMLTPTFDLLFDRGFISFTDDKKLLLSPFLSKNTYSKLKIKENQIIEFLPIDGRKIYLDYHRNNIFKK